MTAPRSWVYSAPLVKISPAMRSAGDADRIPTDAVTLQFILDQYNIPFPAKLPYGQEPRIDKIPSTLEQEPVGLPAESIPPQ